MSKSNSKSLASMRQKLRKYNKEYEKDLATFREAPDAADDDDAEKGRAGNKFFKIVVYKNV
jgi:translation initiation factor 3 subunit C